ncbi:Choline transporter-like protein 5-A [Collichthys lucidus]|uniref:Choline transporter-like protein n=1 Tax=Collichthys lucidus TaxID=240159 RepID=A0A4U5V2G3_COLLU|nr:Choline transporter-like protein 5-A [Collichthys lucidus]
MFRGLSSVGPDRVASPRAGTGPHRFATYSEMQLQHKLSKSYWEYYRQFCKPGFNNPEKPLSQVLRDEDCPSMIMPSRPCMWYCSMELSQLRHIPGSDVAIVEVGLQTDLKVYLQLTQTWIIFLVSLGVTEATILLMLIFLRRRVRVAITLLREASKAIGHIMSTLLFPVITFHLLTVGISYWTFNQTNISTLAPCHGSQCLFAFYGGETSYHRNLFQLQLSNLLVFLWLVNFSLALEQCTLAGTFASYYWAKRKP